ncbi:unnamed protein product, partial [Polarella glacialis]
LGLAKGLILRFFPSGGPNAREEDCCSLYLIHPLETPWTKYELMVGNCVRGPFDPLFGGTDNFCGLSPLIFEDESGQPAVLIRVRFLPVSDFEKTAFTPSS